MTATTTPVVAAVLPRDRHDQAAASWPGPDRDVDDAQWVGRRLPLGVEGHRVVNGRWGRREGRFTAPRGSR